MQRHRLPITLLLTMAGLGVLAGQGPQSTMNVDEIRPGYRLPWVNMKARGYRLPTRDVSRYRTYFPGLALIAPNI